MSLVSVHNEWDPLEEIIVGIPDQARVPIAQKDLFALEYNEHHEDMAQIPSGPYHPQVIEETREDLEALVTVLKQEGVTVRRPQVTDHSKVFSSPGRLFLNECDSRRLRTTGERDIIAFDAVPAGPWFEAGP